jgi:hypothetical protein
MANNRINSYKNQAFQTAQGGIFIVEIAHEPYEMMQCRFGSQDEAKAFCQWLKDRELFQLMNNPLKIELDKRNHPASAMKGNVFIIRFSAEEYFLLSSLAIQDVAAMPEVAEEMKHDSNGAVIIPPAQPQLHHLAAAAHAQPAVAPVRLEQNNAQALDVANENNPLAAMIVNKLVAKDERGVAKTLAELDKIQNDLAAKREQASLDEAIRLSQLDQATRDQMEKDRLAKLAAAAQAQEKLRQAEQQAQAREQAQQLKLEALAKEAQAKQQALDAAAARSKEEAMAKEQAEKVKLAKEQQAANADRLEKLARRQPQAIAVDNVMKEAKGEPAAAADQAMMPEAEDEPLRQTPEEIQAEVLCEEEAAANHKDMIAHQIATVKARSKYNVNELNDFQEVNEHTIVTLDRIASQQPLATFGLFAKASSNKDVAMQIIYNQHAFNSIGNNRL